MDRQQRIDQLRTSGNTTSFRMSKPRAQRRPPVGGKWTSSEDTKLKGIVAEHGPKNWKKIADILGDTRTDVQCLHRWNKVSEWVCECVWGGGSGGVCVWVCVWVWVCECVSVCVCVCVCVYDCVCVWVGG